MRGCWLAWLYWSGSWFYDSWNGLTSTCLQKSSGHYHLFTIDFPLTKGLRHIVEIPPIFFFFFEKRYFKWPLGGSDVLEQTFVNDGWFHSHLPFCTPLLKLRVLTVGRGWQWCIKVYFISISSHSSKLDWTDTFFSPPSRFDLMISSHIFGLLKGLGP